VAARGHQDHVPNNKGRANFAPNNANAIYANTPKSAASAAPSVPVGLMLMADVRISAICERTPSGTGTFRAQRMLVAKHERSKPSDVG
jgi:hypothetical protein